MRTPSQFLVALFLTFSSFALGQNPSFHIDEDVPLGAGAPKSVQCAVDVNNNVVSFPWYIPPSARKAGNTIPTSVCGNFTLIFEDDVNNTGQGYDGSTAQGALMQNVACEVFMYLSRVFNIQGSPEVVFQQAYTNTQTLTLASGSPFYSNTITSGFAPSYMESHAQTGTDPDNSLPDGVIKTNLAINYNFNWPTPSAFNEVDFYTVLLHEALHVMGHVSLIAANGSSKINGPYSVYDSYIANSTGTNFINGSGTAFQASVGDITSNDAHFSNPEGTEKHACYSPFAYNTNSTLSHFDITRPLGCDRLNYVMHPSISYATDRRRITMAEMELMGDLHYDIILTPGDHEIRSYPTAISESVSMTINTTFNQSVVTLNNESDPEEPFTSLHLDPNIPVQVIYGPGSATSVGDNIIYTPPINFIGSVIISYSVYDGSLSDGDIDRYNPACLTITYSTTVCPGDACNFICNGTFENRVAPSCTSQNYTLNTTFNTNMSAWFDYRGSADVLMRDPCAADPAHGGFQSDDFRIPENRFTDYNGGG